jgi:hypothetical protein
MTHPLEASFADAIGIIARAEELPEQTRRHWATSLRQIAKALYQSSGILTRLGFPKSSVK